MLLAIQIAMVAYFNLTDIRNSLDSDFANTIYHFREVVKNGTLNLKDWNHTTSMELDAAFLFAVPVYCLTHNIFLAVGISNLLYVLLYIVTVAGIFKSLQIRKKYMFFTLCLILTPYSFGMLEYFNMMFYGGSCYALKTLTPLLFIWALALYGKQEVSRKDRWVRRLVFCLYSVFLFVTSLSTGIYVMLCGILPVICGMAWNVWKSGAWKGRYRWKQAMLPAGSFAVSAAGYFVHRRLYGLASRTTMNLTKIENYAVNFRACVRGIFDVFGATLSEDVMAMSVKGIWYCLKMIFVVLLLAVWIYNLVLWMRGQEKSDVKNFLTALPLFNFLILLVADSRYTTNPNIEYRYYLIGAVPMILLLGIQLGEWEKIWNTFQRRTVALVSGAGLLVLMAGNNKNVLNLWDRTSYAVELCDYFNTLDVESVFFVNDPDTSHICKGIDENHKYGTFLSDTQSLQAGICSYTASAYGSFYGSRNALAVFIYTTPGDYMPEEIASHYAKVGEVRWFDIYVSDEVWFP